MRAPLRMNLLAASRSLARRAGWTNACDCTGTTARVEPRGIALVAFQVGSTSRSALHLHRVGAIDTASCRGPVTRTAPWEPTGRLARRRGAGYDRRPARGGGFLSRDPAHGDGFHVPAHADDIIDAVDIITSPDCADRQRAVGCPGGDVALVHDRPESGTRLLGSRAHRRRRTGRIHSG